MRFLYAFLLLPLVAHGQFDSDGGTYCRSGKVQFFDQLRANPKARMAYPGDASIDVTYYGLDLRLTHTPASLRAAVTITLKSTTENLGSFFLDLNSARAATGEGLQVDSVKMSTQKLAFQHAQNRLTITPQHPLANGQAITFTVFYQGVPNSSAQGSFKFTRHERTTDPVIWSLSEPYGTSNWFPCRDTPADKADSSSVRITAPAPMVSVSNGQLISVTNNPDSTRTYLWRNSYPIAQYLISIAVSNYAQYDTPFSSGSQTMPITHYIYPEVLPMVKANLDLTPVLMRVFTERFGPYPFLREKYGHAQFSQGNGGMEHQTITSMEERALTPYVIAHELTHQWFGDKITCRDWQNIWLNEGFASYGEALYAESTGGLSGYRSYMNGFMSSARNARGSVYVQDISTVASIFSGSRSYAKGASVLHMFRGIVGDSTFFKIMRTYAASPTLAYQTAVTEDFQTVAQQVSGQNLDYFFKQWIYGEGYPTYRVTASAGSSVGTVSIRLEQRNTLSTNPASFTMPVQIRVQSVVGDTTITVLNNRADQTFAVPIRGTLTGVLIDPDSWILKTVESTTVVTALSEPPPGGLRIYPNPAAEQLMVDFMAVTGGPVTLLLTNSIGQRVRTSNEANLSAGAYTRSLGISGLSAGSYVVTIKTLDGPVSRTVLIQ